MMPTMASAVCKSEFQPAPDGLRKLIDKNIGKENFLNPNVKAAALGFTSANCGQNDFYYCRAGAGRKRPPGFSFDLFYPTTDGWYQILGEKPHFARQMKVGQTLAGSHTIESARKAVYDSVGLLPNGRENNDIEMVRIRGYEIVNSEGNRSNYFYNNRYFSVLVHVHGIPEEIGGPNKTMIDYLFTDLTKVVESCSSAQQNSENSRRENTTSSNDVQKSFVAYISCYVPNASSSQNNVGVVKYTSSPGMAQRNGFDALSSYLSRNNTDNNGICQRVYGSSAKSDHWFYLEESP